MLRLKLFKRLGPHFTEIGRNSFDLEMNLDYKDENVLKMDLNSRKEGLRLENLLYAESDSLSEGQKIVFGGNVGFTSSFKWMPRAKVSFLKSIELMFSIEGNDLRLKGADLDWRTSAQ